jgi:hypothetical protein
VRQFTVRKDFPRITGQASVMACFRSGSMVVG